MKEIFNSLILILLSDDRKIDYIINKREKHKKLYYDDYCCVLEYMILHLHFYTKFKLLSSSFLLLSKYQSFGKVFKIDIEKKGDVFYIHLIPFDGLEKPERKIYNILRFELIDDDIYFYNDHHLSEDLWLKIIHHIIFSIFFDLRKIYRKDVQISEELVMGLFEGRHDHFQFPNYPQLK